MQMVVNMRIRLSPSRSSRRSSLAKLTLSLDATAGLMAVDTTLRSKDSLEMTGHVSPLKLDFIILTRVGREVCPRNFRLGSDRARRTDFAISDANMAEWSTALVNVFKKRRDLTLRGDFLPFFFNPIIYPTQGGMKPSCRIDQLPHPRLSV